MTNKTLNKRQFGDFQTPDNLAQEVIKILKLNQQIIPQLIIEPSCGTGAFIRAALKAFQTSKILGFDINEQYVQQARKSIFNFSNSDNAIIQQADFFKTDWNTLLSQPQKHILIVGNPPWVTSSELSVINSPNLPLKSNFKGRKGIDAITGSSNFDISEWMLLAYIEWLSIRKGTIAILCKYSVARKVMRQLHKKYQAQFTGSIYLINAKSYFNASIEACLFILTNDHNLNRIDYAVYENLTSQKPCYIIGERDGWMIRDLIKYEKWRHLIGQEQKYRWRSGVKHDCSKIMELQPISSNLYQNGRKETYSLEEDYLYPLLKSSDIGNHRISSYRKLILITQKFVGDDTIQIKLNAPNTWQYLVENEFYFSRRKSSIYKNKPPYSIFGIGDYSFKNWKIAISGLYKKLNFCLVSPLNNKPVMFDDTVNFLSFDTEKEARFIYTLLTSHPALECLDAMIFWDNKRPITIDILQRLSLKELAKELDVLEQYLFWSKIDNE